MTTQVYRVYIKATPGGDLGRDHQARVDRALRLPRPRRVRPAAGRRVPRPSPARRCRRSACREVIIDGEVIEADPPRRLVQTWRVLMDPRTSRPRASRASPTRSRRATAASRTLTVTHELEGAPSTAALVAGELEDAGAGGGWSRILSDLKTLLETGSSSTDRQARGQVTVCYLPLARGVPGALPWSAGERVAAHNVKPAATRARVPARAAPAELTAYAYRMLASPFEAEDAVQETFLRGLAGLRAVRGPRGAALVAVPHRDQRLPRHAEREGASSATDGPRPCA